MLGRKAFPRVLLAITMIAAAGTLGGCASGSGGTAGPGATGGSSLDTALASVPDSAVNRAFVSYDDTAELVRLAGSGLSTTKGFAVLRGHGASSLAPLASSLPSDTGISLFAEDYAISAGDPPQTVTLLHGGQNASQVTSRLSGRGWKQDNGTLTGPSPQASVPVAAARTVIGCGK